MTVVDAAGSVVGRTRYGLQPPVVVRAADGGVVEVGGTTYRGAILVQRAGRGGLTFVNRLDMESYLLGVVPREIGPVDAGAYEAAKAQAVAARTYAVAHMGGRASLGFDVYPGTQDQVYGGVAAEREIVSRARPRDCGEVATYGGSRINAYYHSTCAGRTDAIDECGTCAPSLPGLGGGRGPERPGVRPRLEPLHLDGAVDARAASSVLNPRWTTRCAAAASAGSRHGRAIAHRVPAGCGR